MEFDGIQERPISVDPTTIGNPPVGKYWDGYDNTGYWIKLNSGTIVRPDIGTGINYTELNTSLIGSGVGVESSWTTINLGVGFEDALVEILIEANSINNVVGVRGVGETTARFAQVDNDSVLSMSIRADGNGDIQYYQSNDAAIFRIMARWQ